MIYNSIIELIGNTPMLKIPESFHGLKNVNLFVKLELFNPFGSIKDRTALALLKDHFYEIKNKDLTVVESSSGNTAKALQILSSMHDIKFESITNRIKLPETRELLQLLGTKIEELPGLSQCPDPSNPFDPLNYIDSLISKEPNKYFHTSQYTNLKNKETHFKTTGDEIQKDLGKVDYFFGTLGTTGSSRGIVERLLVDNPNLKKVGIISNKNDDIPGIRNADEMLEVGLFEKELYNSIEEVDSIEAIHVMNQLIQKLGILCGPTTGACYLGAINHLKNIDSLLSEKINAVFISCDRVETYLTYIKQRAPKLFEDTSSEENIHTISQETLLKSSEILPQELDDFVSKNSPLIIDLRGNLAFRVAHIKNSINILGDVFTEVIKNTLPFEKSQTVLIVCAIGEHSKKYSALLNAKGLNTYSLKGGINAYKMAGFELYKEN